MSEAGGPDSDRHCGNPDACGTEGGNATRAAGPNSVAADACSAGADVRRTDDASIPTTGGETKTHARGAA